MFGPRFFGPRFFGPRYWGDGGSAIVGPGRGLTPALEAETLSDALHPIILARIGHASGDLRAWSGVGDLLFDGETYLGTGDLGAVSPITETSDLSAHGVTFSMSGIKQGDLATALSEMRQGLPAQLWFGALDMETHTLIADPILIFNGLTDVPSIDEGAETASISITAEHENITLERPETRRYTTEDQHLDDPDDLGFDFVPSLQDKEVIFGS